MFCNRVSRDRLHRFCTPASQCPIIDSNWESPYGVPIDAILFGGRRPKGVPLVYEAFDWKHGVFIGAAMKSEATAAAEHRGKEIMHDPFAMRPFFGYNFGHYLQHWLSMETAIPGAQLPKVYHVNWFRKDDQASTPPPPRRMSAGLRLNSIVCRTTFSFHAKYWCDNVTWSRTRIMHAVRWHARNTNLLRGKGIKGLVEYFEIRD